MSTISRPESSIWKVITASSVGTMIEWYDFYILGSLAVILIVRGALGEAAFKEWGWRIPFVLSLLLLAISYYVRAKLAESPVFAELKATGQTSKAPIAESFGSGASWKIFFTVLFGAA